jgi:hypothetical protein
MKYTQEQLEERFAKAPEPIQKVITSPEVAEQINKLREKYVLHVDDAGTLMDEVGYVLLGFTQPERFVPSLKRALGLPESVVEKIASEINDIVFKPIHNELVQPKKESVGEALGSSESIQERDSILREIESEGTQNTSPVAPTPKNRIRENVVPEMIEKVMEPLPSAPTQIGGEDVQTDSVREKLEKSVHIPTEERNEEDEKEPDFNTPIQKARYGGIDPYREPIE